MPGSGHTSWYSRVVCACSEGRQPEEKVVHARSLSGAYSLNAPALLLVRAQLLQSLLRELRLLVVEADFETFAAAADAAAAADFESFAAADAVAAAVAAAVADFETFAAAGVGVGVVAEVVESARAHV
jgi:hypothetical protein